MILGIGTDIIEIDRILKASLKESFMERIFTEKELYLFKDKKVETVAANFIAKEAVAKALGTGFRGFTPIDIEVLRDRIGKPYVVLHNGALDLFYRLRCSKIHISISHCKDYATAFVIIE